MSTIRSVRPSLLAAFLAAVIGTVALSAQIPVSPAAPAGQLVAGASSADTPLIADGPALLGGDTVPDIILTPSAGARPARVLSGANFAELGAGYPFGPDFGAGVRMALGDVTGDGIADVVMGMGPGGGLVSLLDGNTIASLGGGYPFGPGFGGGVSVAVGDVNGDGRNDIVTGQESGGGTVSVFNGINYAPLFSLRPFGPDYNGGVHVATGDVDNDGLVDIIVGQASGGVVAVINAAAQAVTVSGVPFGNVNGVFVAAGDVNLDGRAEVIAAPGSGNAPVVVYDLSTLTLLGSFVPYPGFDGGVRVAAADISGDGRVEILTVPGPGIAPVLRVYDGASFTNTANIAAYDPSAAAGTLVAATVPVGIHFTSAPAASFAAGVESSFTVRAAGIAPVAITMTGTLPPGVSFADNGNGTATLVGTPPQGTVGAFPLTFRATNGRSLPAQQNFTLTVGAFPAITSADTFTFSVGLINTFTVTTTGTPTPSLTHAGALPAGVTFTDNGNGTATLTGNPTLSSVGTYPLVLTATSSGGTSTKPFVLTVRNGPVFTSPTSASFVVGVAGSFTLTTAGAPQVTSIGRLSQLPNGLAFVYNGDGTGTLAGTPTGPVGVFPLEFSASNGSGNDGFQTLTVTVRQPPTFTSAATTTFVQGTSSSFTVTTTGSPVATLSLSGALPTGVSFTNNGNGTATLAGIPGGGTAGSYPLTFTASNGANTTQTFTLVITGPPAFTSGTATTFVAGTPGSFTIRAAGGPAPTITFTGALPSGVTLVNAGGGTATLAGQPGVGTGGLYPLTLTASNGVGSPATQNLVLTVNQAPIITSPNAASFTNGVASSFTVTTSGYPAPTLSLVSGALPGGVNFTANPNGTATIAGTATTNNPYSIVLQASNGVGANFTQPFTLTVTSCTVVTVSPGSSALAATYQTAFSQTFTATGGSGHVFTRTGAIPAGLTFNSNGTLSGTPTQTKATPYTFTVTATASGPDACAGSTTYNLTVSPNAQNETFNNGVGNTQYSVGAGAPGTPAVVVSGDVLSNDAGPVSKAAGPSVIGSTQGGSVAMATNGTFFYTPPVGFAGPSDTFTYTLTDGNGATDTAVVTINMNSVVWYVNASAPGGGDGRSHSPFNNMPAAAVAAQAGPGQIIYVHPGSPSGVTVLKANQLLQGAGESYSLNGLTIAAGAAPTLGGTITLADNDAVRALNVNGNGSAAISATGLSGNEALTGVSVTAGSSGLSLTNMNGSFTTSGGAISGATNGVAITGGSGTVTIASPVATTIGHSVSVANRTGATVTFSGAISDTGTGILLNANTGSTIAFTGGMSIATGGNPAFTATGGGTVTATQNNGGIVNTLSASASALNVTNTQIGASGLTFRNISSIGGTSTGIILDNTGTSGGNGGLTVTGNGTTTSGGRISGKTGADGVLVGTGIYLNGTKSPAFNRMELFQFTNSAIVGRNVAGFLLADSSIDGAGDAAGVNEGPVMFGLPNPSGVNGLSGTALIRNTPINGGFENNVTVYGQSGTMSLTIDRNTLNPPDCKIEANGGTSGAQGVLVRLEGSAVGTVAINGCTMRGNRDAAVHATALGTSSLTLTVDQNSISNNGQGNRGVVLTNGGDAALAATISSNTFESLPQPAVQMGQTIGAASATSILRATVINNDFDSSNPASANTIVATVGGSAGAASRTRLLVQDNYAHHYGLQPAVLIEATDPSSAPVVDMTFAYNHFDMAEVGAPGSGVNGPLGLIVQNTQASSANMCGNITPNTFHWIPIESGTGGGISLRQGGANVFKLERGTQTLATPAATVLALNNGMHSGGPAPGPPDLPGSTTGIVGTISVVENGTCKLPSAP